MNIVSFAFVLFGSIATAGQGSELINHRVIFEDVNLNDYFYNGVLNDLVISAEVNGVFEYEIFNGTGYNTFANNSFEISLRFDSESGENVFSAMSEELQMISLERYGKNDYAMSCFDTIEMSLDLDRIEDNRGFIDFVYTLYIDFGLGEDYYFYNFPELITMHYSIEDINLAQNISEVLHEWENGLAYYDNYASRLVLENDSSYYYNLVLENKEHWEEQGRINGYEQGYQEGINSTPTGVLELITKPFIEMGQFLNISIAPNLTLGMIISVPIVVAIIGFLIKALIA